MNFMAPQSVSAFAFASPADDLLEFSGPRGDDYNNLCKSAMATAVRRCGAAKNWLICLLCYKI